MSRPLPSHWVESLFARLAVKYGRAFLAQYEGIDLAFVKQDWARELGGFFVHTGGQDYDAPAISWALENLPPGKPLNAMEFRALCRRFDPPQPLALPQGPKKIPPQVARAFAEAVKNTEPPKEPQRIRIARAYIEKWTAPGAHPTSFQRDVLKVYQRLVERYDAPASNELDDLKAKTAERVEAYEKETADEK